MNTNTWEGLLLDVVTSTKEGVTKGVDVAMKQVPEVVDQLLRWKLVENAVYGLVMLLVVATIVGVMWKYWAYVRASEDRVNDDNWIWVGIIASFFTVFISAIILKEVYDSFTVLLQIYVAPKLYLIEYFSKLLK